MPQPDEDARPAARGELRSLRRWIAVAGVWAVAGTAIAVIALVDQGDSESEEAATSDLATRVTRIQRQLDERIDALETRLETVPSSDDVSKLEDRLQKAEDDSSAAADGLKRVRERIDDLEQRVDEVEQGDGGGGGSRSPGGGGGEQSP